MTGRVEDMMNRNSDIQGRVFKIYDESESRNEGACLRYMMNRNRQMGGMSKISEEPESPNEGVCLIYNMNPRVFERLAKTPMRGLFF